MNRRDFLFTGASFAAGTFAGHAHPHEHHFPDAAFELAAANPPASADSQPTGSGRIVSGSGDFRYEYVPTRLVLPAEVKMRNGHGLCLDTDGNIYFTFEPEKVEPDTRCLVRFAPDGTNPVLLGSDNAPAHGVPHGLNHPTGPGRQAGTLPCQQRSDGSQDHARRAGALDPEVVTAKLLGAQGFKHPHDAIWLANGDIAVCTWNPGRLGYWRRLPPAGQ